MRMQGTLKKWNADKAYGFISQGQGKPDLFVHISAFQKNGQTPLTGEVLTFDVVQGQDGRWQAVRVLRPGETPSLELEPMRRSPQPKASSKESSTPKTRRPVPRAPERPSLLRRFLGNVFWLGLILLLATMIYKGIEARSTRQQAASSAISPLSSYSGSQNSSAFSCDGREHCSQMRSCEEAKFFIANCPNTKMDGDNDGRPCEQDLCSFSF